jgi:hypothetical protein
MLVWTGRKKFQCPLIIFDHLSILVINIEGWSNYFGGSWSKHPARTIA